MNKAALFIEKTKGAIKAVRIGVDMLVGTNNDGVVDHIFDLHELILAEVSSHTAGIDGENIDMAWLKDNVSADDFFGLMVSDVEGPSGNWMGAESGDCTVVGPIECTVTCGNTLFRVSGVEDPEGLGMSSQLRVTTEGDRLEPNRTYLLIADVAVSMQ